jgi:putative transposase
VVGPKAKREQVLSLIENHSISKARACKVLGLRRSTLDYKPNPRSDEPVAGKLIELATKHRRFGHPRLHVLLQREGLIVNHKRSERIYQNLGLQIKNRRRKKRGAVARKPVLPATRSGEVLAIDFMFDHIETGRRLKILTIVDEFGKSSPSILVDHSIRGIDVAHFLDTVLPSYPKVIRVDQGTEFTSNAFMDWAYKKKIELQFTSVGKPNQLIEAFNSRCRDEVLNDHVFFSLEDAREKIDQWHWNYNNFNPHSSLGMKTPAEFAKEQELMLTA